MSLAVGESVIVGLGEHSELARKAGNADPYRSETLIDNRLHKRRKDAIIAVRHALPQAGITPEILRKLVEGLR